MLKTAATVIAVALLAMNASAQLKDQIKLLLSMEIPVDVSIDGVNRTYHSESEQFTYTIDYSITNLSDTAIGQVAFIEYNLSKNGSERGITVWSEREIILPYSTKQFSTNNSFGDYENSIAVWNVYSVCFEFGSIDIDLSGVRKAVSSYVLGKTFLLPKAKGSLYPRCGPDE